MEQRKFMSDNKMNIVVFILLGKCIPGQFSDGRDYRGNLDHTIDGVTCQKWSSQYPHSHKLLPYPYTDTEEDNDGLGKKKEDSLIPSRLYSSLIKLFPFAIQRFLEFFAWSYMSSEVSVLLSDALI